MIGRSVARIALFTFYFGLMVFGCRPIVALAQPFRDQPPAAATATESGYLGIVTDDRQENGQGVRIVERISDSPAVKAGLQTGDLIVGLNGKPVRTTADMSTVLQNTPPGGTVTFEVDRSGQSKKIAVTLGNRPAGVGRPFAASGSQGEALPAPSLASGARRAVLGVTGSPLTAETRRRLKIKTEAGALVSARTSGSAAAAAGIPIDAVITAFNGAPVSSPDDLHRLVADVSPGEQASVDYEFEGKQYRATVKLGEASGPTAPVPGPASSPARSTLDLRSAERAAPTSDAARIEALEQRVESLERRVRELERGGR